MEFQKIQVVEVAKLLGKSNLFIYEAMRRGVLNIGVAMRFEGNKKWSFSISPTLLAEYMGIDVPTLNEMVKKLREKQKGEEENEK